MQKTIKTKKIGEIKESRHYLCFYVQEKKIIHHRLFVLKIKEKFILVRFLACCEVNARIHHDFPVLMLRLVVKVYLGMQHVQMLIYKH